MAVAWPSSVPWSAITSSWQDAMEDNKVSFKPEVGPEIERRVLSIDTDIVSFTLPPLSEAETLALKTFYRTTLKSGVLPFENTHPAYASDVTVHEWKFRSPPAIRGKSFGLFDVSIELRLMP